MLLINQQKLFRKYLLTFFAILGLISPLTFLSGCTFNQAIRKVRPTISTLTTVAFDPNSQVVKVAYLNTYGRTIPNKNTSPYGLTVEDCRFIAFGIEYNNLDEFNYQDLRKRASSLNHSSSGDIQVFFDSLGRVKRRGSSSQWFSDDNYWSSQNNGEGLNWPKYNYNIKFNLLNGKPLDHAIFELSGNRDFVLIGPFSDKTFIRDALAYELARQIGLASPDYSFCELIVDKNNLSEDEDYLGVYMIVEKIEISPKRLAINKLDPLASTGDDMSGGYILKIDRPDSDEYAWDWSHRSGTELNKIVVHSHNANQLSASAKSYIKNRVTDFEDALWANDFSNVYANYLDIDSIIAYMMLNELANNADAYRLSNYFYKDRDSVNPKFVFGPAWDYNLAFGNDDEMQASLTHGWRYKYIESKLRSAMPFWFSKLMSDTNFRLAFKLRWQSLRSVDMPLHDNSIALVIDSLVSRLGSAIDRSYTRFPNVLGALVWPNPPGYETRTSYASEIAWLKTWLINRSTWLDAEIASF